MFFDIFKYLFIDAVQLKNLQTLSPIPSKLAKKCILLEYVEHSQLYAKKSEFINFFC